MKELLRKVEQFVLHDAWHSELSSLTGIRRVVTRLLRIAELVVKGFRDDKLNVQASALTFTSLISLVPLLAIAFALLKGLGAGDEVLLRIHDNLDVMPEQFREFVEQMLAIVNRTNFWTLGWVGVIVLFVSVVQVLSSIEASFNQVWGVKSSRALWRRMANYISIIVVVPVLIMMAFAVNTSLSNASVISRLGEAALLYNALLRLLPYLATIVAIFLLFMFVPNTKIAVRPAFISSFVTTLLWLGWQNLYINLQLGVARYNAIYGTFASVPIFLAWLYISWVLLLFGAELCFALQNHATYDLERSAGNANLRAKVMLAFAIILQAGQSFRSGQGVFNAEAFAGRHRIPIRLINELIRLLERDGLMAEVAEQEHCYVLRRPLESITLRQVLELVQCDGTGPERYGFGAEASAVFAAMACYDGGLEATMSAVTLGELLDQHPPAAEVS